MPLTPSQELAASVRGRPLLVSAAAGSGKTRVLVERLMRHVDDGADIDEFLVITYTRAAAAELRSRILRELNARLAENPTSRRLRRQTELCCRAGIGTIDSICGRILREYVHLTGLTPDFRVVEEERADAMKRAALDRVLEERYEHMEENAAFRALADSVGAGRDDRRLVELTLQLFDSLRSHPHPHAWMADCREALLASPTDAAETVWGRRLLERCARSANYWAARLSAMVHEMQQPGHEALLAAYGEGFITAAEALRETGRAAAMGWDRCSETFPIPMKIKAFRKEDPLKAHAKALWDECRKACGKLETDFSQRSSELLADLALTAPAMTALLELTADLDRSYSAEKRRQAVVDFSDQEHMVLQLLEDEQNGVGAELSARWREVMVDEYQDVNECQDRLFTALSGGGQKLFLVGDVKQSIYRFRLADPTIFLDKYRRFEPVEAGRESREGGLILLRENFRSAANVLAGCNSVFENILSRELGDLDYDEGARLVHGRGENSEAPAFTTRLSILDIPEGSEGEKQDKTAMEAAFVATESKRLLDEGTLIPEGDSLRPLQPGDIAILLRSYKGSGERYTAALRALGISVMSQQGGGFFRSLEVTALLSLLSVIDNPRQDIPLIAVLRSPLYGFSADELSQIRARDKKSDFYTALCAAADEPHCAAFLRELEEYRALAPELTVAELLGRIGSRSELFALFSAMPDGQARRENYQLLLDYARQFEQGGYRGLGSFVSWMKRLQQRGEEPRRQSGEGGNAVQLMSIHRSKGLEYPVVFLCGTAKKFNLSDSQSKVLVHPRLGLGCKVTDSALGAEWPSLAWRAIAAELRQESLSEEMRVLYVAMTRARERLYITAAWPKAEEKLQKLSEGLCSPIAPTVLEGDASLSQWLARCALLCPETLTLSLVPPVERLGSHAVQTAKESSDAPLLHIAEKLRWHYAHADAETLPSKLTASQLKAGEWQDADLQRPKAPAKPARMPDFTSADRPLSAAERGTAMHLALQFIDLHKCGSRAEIEEELTRLETIGQLTKKQRAAVSAGRLEKFFRSEIGQRLLRAERVWREQRFSLLMKAADCGYAGEEEILFQGVVDCCMEEEGALTILDYKTDFVTAETIRERAEGYAPQISAYAAAMERILKKPVKETVLYFLALDTPLSVKLLK